LAKKILVIEDEPAVRLLMQDELEFEGFELRFAESGGEGLEVFFQDRPDLVLLDLMLPDISGFEICRKIREADLETPVILVSARSQEADKVRGLDLGADDYITKPFSLPEVVARVRAVLRGRSASTRARSHVLGGLRLDVRRREAAVGERVIDLTPKEFDLLRYLLEHRGEAVGRDEILDAHWPGVFVTHRTVDTHISSLRKKLGDGPGTPEIESVRGIGYKIRPRSAD
jgi:DNA-binding response OmpR family regulator